MNNHIENPNTHNRLITDSAYMRQGMNNLNALFMELRPSQALAKQ